VPQYLAYSFKTLFLGGNKMRVIYTRFYLEIVVMIRLCFGYILRSRWCYLLMPCCVYTSRIRWCDMVRSCCVYTSRIRWCDMVRSCCVYTSRIRWCDMVRSCWWYILVSHCVCTPMLCYGFYAKATLLLHAKITLFVQTLI
jgi:hypothetical protein